MLFSRDKLRSRDVGAARDTLRALWPTSASPVTFAIPIDVAEDDEAFTLVFAVAQRDSNDVSVKVEGNSIRVEGAGALRTFWVSAALEADRVEVEFGEAELKVRAMKSRVVAARRIIVRKSR